MKPNKPHMQKSFIRQYDSSRLNIGFCAIVLEIAADLEHNCENVTKNAKAIVKILEVLDSDSANRAGEVELFSELTEFENRMEKATYDEIEELNLSAKQLALKLWKKHRELASLNGLAVERKNFLSPRPYFKYLD